MRDIYERVNLAVSLDERRFFDYFNDTVNELIALYPDFLFKEGVEYVPVTEMEPIDADVDYNPVLPLYSNAIVDNIIFFVAKEETYKAEFFRKAKQAYLKYWKDNAKDRRVKRVRW